MQTSKNILIAAIAVSFLILIAIIIGVLIFWQSSSESSDGSTDEKTDYLKEEHSITPQEIIDIVADTVNNHSKISTKGTIPNDERLLWVTHVFWITNDGYNITMKNNPTLVFKTSVDKDFSPPFTIKNLMEAMENKTLTEKVVTTLEDRGFSLDEKNSIQDLNEAIRDYVLAYQKDNTLCTWTLYQGLHNIEEDEKKFLLSALSCTDQLEENYNKYKPIIDDIELRDSDAFISVEKEKDNFYYLLIGGRTSGGYYSIVRKVDGKYEEIYAGQDTIPCSKVEEFNVPEEIYGECYEEDE